MDVAKTSPLFHLCWKWKYNLEHVCLAKPICHHLDVALSMIDELVSMVLQAMCEVHDCLCFEFVCPLVDAMFNFVEPFLVILLEKVDMTDHVTYVEWVARQAMEAKQDLCQMLHHCNHASLLSKYNALK